LSRRWKIGLACSLLFIGFAAAILSRKGDASRTEGVGELRAHSSPSPHDGHASPRPLVRLDGTIEAGAATASAAALLPEAGAAPPELPSRYSDASHQPSTDEDDSGAAMPARLVGDSPPTSPAMRTHRLADGDTLSDLAERYLGSRDRFAEIYEANRDRLTAPDLLPLGVELTIPPSEPPTTPRSEPSPSTPPDVEEAPLKPLAPSAWRRRGSAASGRSYQVRTGDTLPEIARRFYGNEARAAEIREANPGRLEREGSLPEGMTLIVP
jgi:nucleoid-associated protein YgaU